MENNTASYGQMDFNLPHDVVQLPSKGLFYKSRKKQVKIGYLTASDENVIMSGFGSSSREGVVLNLIRNKLYEPDLKPEELLEGDVEAILIFLRNTSFGSEYVVNLIDDETDKKFTITLNLEELNFKDTPVKPNDNGEFITTLPKSGNEVKLKPMTYFQKLDLQRKIDEYPSGRVSPKVTMKLLEQIVELNGNPDKGHIATFVNSMPIMDSKFIQNFMYENEPRIDLKKDVITPSGKKVSVNITFGVEFFRPFF